MACSTAVGTVEFRSLLEPVRTANPFVNYFEAACDRIDLENKGGQLGSRQGAGDSSAGAGTALGAGRWGVDTSADRTHLPSGFTRRC